MAQIKDQLPRALIPLGTKERFEIEYQDFNGPYRASVLKCRRVMILNRMILRLRGANVLVLNPSA